MSGRVLPEDLRSEGGVVRWLRLDRVEKKNAFDAGLAGALMEALEAAAADDAVRVVVLGANGDVFSGGADVSLFLAIAQGQAEEAAKVRAVPDALRAFPKPLLAAVQGPAVGMGVTMLPHFDAVYAAEEASFTLPFVRLGLVQEFGSSATLPRLIGRQRAAELLYRATPLDAETAAEWGLVTRVFPRAELRDAVSRIALEIAVAPLGALREAKALLRGAEGQSVEEAMAAEDGVLESRYGSPENVEAVQAFLARKRR
ncbi:MAG TPA: enoyl-CoA hydratase-related protein [Polyangiaceae bacterium LLY-WYZ-15_(1-7)]|nr:enoyl-CoA hydratase-related protein [Polyangiaceae bacterium LLY-WYZ-15_(1-7)]HJL03500.1 enoyl-CoA hydratase-related protein [Polyangiaceae bacterium LLY-WYZ-15_(1-7)]HJL10288.1 enoyl-CoA hydratase-related protein [Polyangiaceae bacterium LLY-WYZ-15_(1-7)]HJL27265.1 enoyl-CoA hydratase-related protein [Polyangiaceae bacterium LLY-WYZ-15_(1-7)]HJL33670.1 enoyl-CoA hydratase-related protein [Polyangiaceae bacterium LLY-WYZ-15_(1-7)]